MNPVSVQVGDQQFAGIYFVQKDRLLVRYGAYERTEARGEVPPGVQAWVMLLRLVHRAQAGSSAERSAALPEPGLEPSVLPRLRPIA